MPRQRSSFFPKAEAAVLRTQHEPPSPTSRPTETAPIFDTENVDRALDCWSQSVAESLYPVGKDVWTSATIPDKPRHSQTYLFPILTRNERLRLVMLYYYTQGALEDIELMSRLQEKVYLAQETVGWEFAIAGLLNHNTYTRMVTAGLPLAVLPRRESTCAHTVNQPPGTVFTMLNMAEDWRFKESPHVASGGLRAYAGVPLRFETESGEHVAFGSLCVASNFEQKPLSKEQQVSLARLADWIVADIISSARTRRQKERRRMQELLANAQRKCDMDFNMEDEILALLRTAYPSTAVSFRTAQNERIDLGDGTNFATSEIDSSLWEDCDCIDQIIQDSNHQDPVANRTIRAIVVQCATAQLATYLIVGCKDFRIVFDDVDAWFVQMCAAILCRFWQNRTLKEALTAKETFLRGITHHLRTPIHGILGSVDLLTEELKSRNIFNSSASSSQFGSPSDEQIYAMDPYMYIKNIKSAAQDLISTVNSLIKLNQWADVAEAERVVEIYTIDEIETALLNEVTPLLPDTFERPSIIVHHHLPQQSDMLTIDLRLFIDCIQPLFLNAIQNTPSSGVVSVNITATDDYGSLVVDVEDNGRGISPENQQRVFNAYEKVDPHTPDAGLGLTLAAKLARLMSGNLSLVSSEVGKGSHFQVTFSAPTCACSYESHQRTRPVVPSTFYGSVPTSEPTSLGRSFRRYLTSRGYTECNDSGALLILDYTSDITELYKHVSRVSSGQAAICLVPEQDTFIVFIDGRIQRDNNVLYIKGPFTSSIFEEALVGIQSILAEAGTLKAGTVAPSDGGVAILAPTMILQKQVLGANQVLPGFDLVVQEPMSLLKAELGSMKSMLTLRVNGNTGPPAEQKYRKPRTLIVDDNLVNLRLLEMYCTRRGIPYRTATNGAKAVELYSSATSPPTEEPFDLVLMDLQMPICDGITATQEIRELEQKNGWPRSVIFIVTGQDSPSDRASAQEVGSDWYMVKPVGPKVMDRTLKQWFPDADIA